MATTTLALDGENWDLISENGTIKVLSGANQLAQDAASACRLFLSELWFDTSQGVPYWQQMLGVGKLPPSSLVIANLQAAALNVNGVKTVTITITTLTARTIGGEVTVTGTDASGNTITGTASF